MNNQCYALNLPQFNTIVNDGIDIIDFISDHIPIGNLGKYLFYTRARKIFKESFLKSFNVDFVECHCFYKPTNGGIHIDLGNYTEDNIESCWGINWNFGSPAIYDYWNFSDMDSITHCFNEQNHPHTILSTNKPSTEQYIHHQGPILFNATVPHRARLNSTTPRYAVSLRMSNPMISWNAAIKIFEEFIIDDTSILQRL